MSVVLYSDWERERFAHTLGFVQGAHGEQKRKYTNDPYWTHCYAVAELLSKVPGRTIEMIQLGLLHDVREDTKITKATIELLFGLVLADWVELLSDPPGNRETRTDRVVAKMTYAPWEVQTAKAADLFDNTKSIAERDPDFARVYLPEKDRVLAVLTRADPTIRAMCNESIERNMAQIVLARRHVRLG